MMRFLLSSVLIALSLRTGSSTSIADEAGKVYELRTYHTFPGRLDALHKRFREHTIDSFKKHEMTSVGYWTPMDEKDGKGNTLVSCSRSPAARLPARCGRRSARTRNGRRSRPRARRTARSLKGWSRFSSTRRVRSDPLARRFGRLAPGLRATHLSGEPRQAG